MFEESPMPSKSKPALLGLCNHCGLPLKAGSFNARAGGQDQSFCCYGCYICQRMMGESDGGGASNFALARMALGGLLGMPLMALSVIDYVGGFNASDTIDQVALVYWIIFGLATGIVLLLGIPYFISAARSLFFGTINADVLIALGALTAYGTSAYTFLTTEDMAELAQGHQLYFDSGSMILVLVSLGKFIEAAARKRTTANLKDLSEVDAADVTLIEESGSERLVKASELVPMQVIRLAPGASVPADGEVIAGTSEIAEAMLTGEGRPVAKKIGDTVLAGTVNGAGSLDVRVRAVGADSMRARVMGLAREALNRRSASELIVDRIARFFVPAVLVVAGGAFAYHAYIAPSELLAGTREAITEGVRVALSVLVVACPCALGLATPLAVAIGISRAAQMGMLFRSGEAIEALAKIERIYLDKTGTLTTGDFSVAQATLSPTLDSAKQAQLWSALAAIESRSEHWLARGLITHAHAQPGCNAELAASDVQALPGKGVEGQVQGARWWAGSPAILEAGITLASELQAQVDRASEQGQAIVIVGCAEQALAVIALADTAKPNADRAVARLRRMGVEPVMVTGDHAEAASVTARALGIAKLYAGVLPEQKLALIEAEADPSRVAMTGDGVNDGPALMAAGVGISFANATGLARLAAGLTLIGDDLLKLANAVPLARRTAATIRLNLVWAFIYNIGAVIVATTGYLAPSLAAAAMLFSSVFVVWNSWRLSRYGGL